MAKPKKVETDFHLVGNEFIPESEYQARVQRERNKKDNIRTTFRIPESLLEQFKDVAKGYKLIDLFEDLADLVRSKELINNVFSDETIDSLKELKIPSPRKSFLLSRHASSGLTEISKKLGVSRDNVVNYLVTIWINAQEKQQAKRRKAYQKAQDKFYEAIAALEEMEEILKEAVPSNDPYFTDIGFSLQTLYNADIAIQQYFETGEYQNDLSL